MKGSLVNSRGDLSSGRLERFTSHGEGGIDSWLLTAAIKGSGRGNVFLKLRAHILVVGHMQFPCMAPTLAARPSWWRLISREQNPHVFPQTLFRLLYKRVKSR